MNMYNTKILQYWGRQQNFGILTPLPLQRQLGVSLCILYYELTNLNLFFIFNSFYYHQGFIRTNHSIVKCVMCV